MTKSANVEWILGPRTAYGVARGTPEWDAENARRAVLRRAADRRAALIAYGGDVPRCSCCGEMRDRFLQLDHIDGGGNQHRKEVPATRLYSWLRNRAYPAGFRILCANCNFAMGITAGRECAHGTEIILFKRLSPAASLPVKAYADDAGYDLFASAPAVVHPGQFADIPTGVAMSLPFGIWARITGRSSTFRRRGLLVVDGTIDTSYTGELFTGVINLTPIPVEIATGERLAQMILHPVVHVGSVWADELPATRRGSAGFGSTGQ